MRDVIAPQDTPSEAFPGGIAAQWIVTAATTGATEVTLGRATYPPGTGVEPHRHPHAEEVVLVLRGRAEHVIDGRRSAMGPGDVCFIPRMAPHELRNASDDELEIVWVYGGASSLEQAGFESLSAS